MLQDSFNNDARTTETIKAVLDNHEPALKILYRVNYPKVETYILNNSGTAEEAKDIYQEAFIILWRAIKMGRFSGQTGASPEGFLYRTAKNKWLDHLRKVKKVKLVPLREEAIDTADTVPGDMVAEQQQIDDIQINLKLLGENCRDILDRFYYRRQSMEQIASTMNWTAATAKNNKYRCLQKLRELLKRRSIE